MQQCLKQVFQSTGGGHQPSFYSPVNPLAQREESCSSSLHTPREYTWFDIPFYLIRRDGLSLLIRML